jgi:hypothetical protein
MSEPMFWLPAVVALGLFGAATIVPAVARGGHAGGAHGAGFHGAAVHGAAVRGAGVRQGGVLGAGVHSLGSPAFRSASFVRVPLIRDNLGVPGVVPRQFAIGNDRLLRRRDQFENVWPIGIWPFWPSGDTIPAVVTSSGSDVPASRSVTVVSGAPNGEPERTESATPRDYSYVAGCHAIPNGYHCDSPRHGR